MTWERPAYQRLNGHVSADGERVLIWCPRCLAVHSGSVSGGESYQVAGCNRKGGFAGYVVVEGRRRFESEAAEAEWIRHQFHARGLVEPSPRNIY
jgi:hypothetical protein